MGFVALAVLLPVLSQARIERDAFGVPWIRAASKLELFALQGYAAAQDRWSQMDLSRAMARGRLAAKLGRASLPSDRETLRLGYTDAELQAQIDSLAPVTREALRSYVGGVNRWLEESKRADRWSELDSAAVFVSLGRRFGNGGAGELRNLALLRYLEAQPKAKPYLLDIFDDLIWFNDPRSIPTVTPGDDPVKIRPAFPQPNRSVTESHMARLPKANLMELMPAVRLAAREESAREGERLSVPYRVGSYAVLVAGKRSATGWPILLSAPQMGHGKPSVVHEVCLEGPDYKFSGMGVPGVPGVVVGANDRLAIAVTSGVADTDDILFYEVRQPGTYRFEGKDLPIQTERIQIDVRGGDPESFVRERTLHGPIVLRTATGVFVQRSTSWGRELKGLDAILQVPTKATPNEIEEAMRDNPLSFNLFYATRSEIGYLYSGQVPVRPGNLDPRLPIPATKETVALPLIPPDQMPRVRNPRSGLLANWNNKPAAWWANSDSPTWGRIFRNEVLLDQLTKSKLTVADVELAAWTIARRSDSWKAMRRYLPDSAGSDPQTRPHAEVLHAWDGWRLAGQNAPALYEAWLGALRTELVAPITGSFLNDSTFRTVTPPSFLLNALEGRTKTPFLEKRSADEVARAALRRVSARPLAEFGFVPGTIRYGESGSVPYSDRGTYIQVVELGPIPRARNIAAPGTSESGPHSVDQIPLAAAWTYKPMRLP